MKEATKQEVEKFISGAKKYRKTKEEKPPKQPPKQEKAKLTFGIQEPYDPFGLCMKPGDDGFGEPLSIKIIRDAEGKPIIKHLEK